MTRISEQEYARLLSRNPEIRTHETVARKRAPIPVESDTDKLSASFESLWRLLGGPELVKEHRFHPTRKWLLDYAHLGAKVAIEINGGIWSGGRHVRPGGYLRDREKVNAAQLMGWRVVELGTGQVTVDNLEPVIQAMRQGIG